MIKRVLRKLGELANSSLTQEKKKVEVWIDVYAKDVFRLRFAKG